jgi:ketohexokinase
MSRILVVGNVTLDIIHSVDHYPSEDEELRASSQRRQRGGNAANTACVLAQHGHQVSYAGTLADDSDGQYLGAELARAGVDWRYCQVIPAAASPLSCITHNLQTGSRTIVHYRDLPEYPASAFAAIPLTEYDWFHFEGRNLAQLPRMLEQVHRIRIDQPISIEVEKARPGIEQLFGFADVLLFARAYATARDCPDARQLFSQVQALAEQAILVCGWGEQGAYAHSPDGTFLEQAAEPLGQIDDSVGAGDTFHAGLIHGLLSGQRLQEALGYASALAAKKLRQPGFDRLVEE